MLLLLLLDDLDLDLDHLNTSRQDNLKLLKPCRSFGLFFRPDFHSISRLF